MTAPTAHERANSIYMSIRAEVRPGQFLRDAIERAITAAEEAARADEREWRPIESAPRDGTPFLCVWHERVRVAQWGKTSHVPLYGFCLADQGVEDFDLITPDVWVPLPEPPRSKEPT